VARSRHDDFTAKDTLFKYECERFALPDRPQLVFVSYMVLNISFARATFAALPARVFALLVCAIFCKAGVKTMSVSKTSEAYPPCSLGRRVGAMVYDALILIAIWMVGTAFVVVAANAPIDGGNPLFQFYLLALALAYFHVSWSRIEQTLGMRAWRIRLDPGPQAFTLQRSLKRFVAGLVSLLSLGLGFAWALFRSDRRAWPDIASESRLVVVAKTGRRPHSSAQQHKSQKTE
jgi:uncharacterized RDD family membrane protein YckC